MTVVQNDSNTHTHTHTRVLLAMFAGSHQLIVEHSSIKPTVDSIALLLDPTGRRPLTDHLEKTTYNNIKRNITH